MSERIANSVEHPILELTDENVAAMLRRVVRLTAGLGVAAALVLWVVSGWQTAALFAVGATISIGSIYEWARLIRMVMARMDRFEQIDQIDQMEGKSDAQPANARRVGLGPVVVILLFLMRLTIAGVAIYVSLKCFHGSPIALLCGLGLALAGLVWEAMRVLRG
ncbi:hypothetical protein ACFPT7_19865 [Acidicapsa dinghuensis]|uniref:DUF202 domain-containing protein n=1 Tax=Acidicapsa dinghuensis TaxID=2218256 RepID=A0ABW1EK46_9BACT|nr:hypothetical protein [Acidicapsa dinghuensis]